MFDMLVNMIIVLWQALTSINWAGYCIFYFLL